MSGSDVQSGSKALRVLVTRPAAQSARFIERLKDANLHPLSLPTIAIEFTDTDLHNLLDCDLIIFTSANSVNGAHRIKPLPWQFDSKVAAIGKATADTLSNKQVDVDLMPERSASSEALLDIIGDVSNRRVAIVRGDSGRETLHDTLIKRGASVQYFCVYTRTIPHYTRVQINQCLSAGLPDIVSITSDLGLNNLIEIIPDDLKSSLLKTPLVVNSDRCAQKARQFGFTAQVLIANPPGDDGQVPEISRLAQKLLTQR